MGGNPKWSGDDIFLALGITRVAGIQGKQMADLGYSLNAGEKLIFGVTFYPVAPNLLPMRNIGHACNIIT